MAEVRIAILGPGKIAQDQHLPAIAGDPRFRLAATVSPDRAGVAGVPAFATVDELAAAGVADAVAICTPPAPRHRLARQCLAAGLHVLLEKPPCATVGEAADLIAAAGRAGVALFAAWHSQANAAVVRATAITRAEGVAAMAIRWLEDVERWHPGQRWIWEPGGFGVFDPGINALSIATRLCPEPLLVREAELVLHADGQQPEAATLAFAGGSAPGRLEARFNFRHQGTEEWTIALETLAGTRLRLTEGGAVLQVDDGPAERGAGGEYPALYARFAELVAGRAIDVDLEPLRVVADARLVARTRPAAG